MCAYNLQVTLQLESYSLMSGRGMYTVQCLIFKVLVERY